MPITFRCPECGGLLSVPRKMQGQIINCTHNGCVVEVRGGTATETGGNGHHTVTAVAPPVAAPPEQHTRPSLTAGIDPVNAPAGRGAGKVAPVVRRPRSPRADWLQRNVARFIKSDGALTTFKPTSDGRLPELNLVEGPDRRALGESKGANPLVMIGMLCLSFVMSTVLLFVDFGPTESASNKQVLARRQLAEFYKHPRDTLEPYQQYLREAQQAHSRGDFETERRLYRRVLNLLRAEGRGRFASLTRTQKEDKELEALLSALLAEGS